MKYKNKQAVFFDFGDTLTSTIPSYSQRCAISMRKAGYNVNDEEFEYAYFKTDYEIYKKYKARNGVTPNEYKDWFFPILCKYLNIKEEPFKVRYEVSQCLNEIEFERQPLPGSLYILNYLKDKNFILGVISNNDGYTEDKCRETGIYKFFDIIADSTVLNMIKPDKKIFDYVINELDIDPSRCVHVGDLYGSDVKGGTNAGIDVIWFNKKSYEKPDNSRILNINSISEISEIL